MPNLIQHAQHTDTHRQTHTHTHTHTDSYKHTQTHTNHTHTYTHITIPPGKMCNQTAINIDINGWTFLVTQYPVLIHDCQVTLLLQRKPITARLVRLNGYQN